MWHSAERTVPAGPEGWSVTKGASREMGVSYYEVTKKVEAGGGCDIGHESQ